MSAAPAPGLYGLPRAPKVPGGPRAGDRLDRWLAIDPDGTVVVRTGKVELGQGIHAALAIVAADELDVPLERVRVATVDTEGSPDEGYTAGSRSIEESVHGLRRVAAEARLRLLERAAERLQVAVAELSLGGGVITAPDGRYLGFADLASDELLAAPFGGEVAPKAPEARGLIGRTVPRLDLVAKVSGQPAFLQDMELPGMLHGRVIRPPAYGARLRTVDEAAIRALPGIVAVVRDGSFLGLVAQREDQAVAALEPARAMTAWDGGPPIRAVADAHYLLEEPCEVAPIKVRESLEARARTVRHVSAEYSRPHIAHAALGPSCAIASFDGERYVVWSHSQGIFRLRHALAVVLGVDQENVRVIHAQGSGCYGHNGADDVALDAVLLARQSVGRPVRVQWMRQDEFAWEPYGPAAVVRMSAGLDESGRIQEWTHDLWTHSHDGRPADSQPPRVSSLLAARDLADPFEPPVGLPARSPSSGGQRNSVPSYPFPDLRVTDHFVSRAPLRVSSLRGLGAHPNVFAIESFMDEAAIAAAADPVEFRLRHLEDPRSREVIERVAELAGWQPFEQGDGDRGRGIGFARYKGSASYAAVIVEVELDVEVRVRRAWAAIDAGMVVSREGLLNQAEGGIIQAIGWTLSEEVTANAEGITSLGWDTYRTLRFPEAPDVTVALIDRPDQPPMGAGEAFAGPTSAAIANAIHNAIGLRMRDLPITRERLIAAMG